MFTTEFNSILDILNTFNTEEKCIKYLEQILWGGCVESPFIKDSKVYVCKNGKYKCSKSGKYFNVKTNTIFESTKISLKKWFVAIWLITSHKKGISSMQLAKDIGVTQKTAWYILQKIRSCFVVENNNELEGVIEADETFIGGKNKNRHKDKKVKNSQGRSFKDKVPVLGLLERGGKMTAIVISDTKGKTIQPLVKKYVKEGSKFISDEWWAYQGLGVIYEHEVIDHSSKEYVRLNDNTIHTNTIEGSWNILKKSVCGMYNHVAKKHLQRYVDEFVFRYNTRNNKEDYRFNLLLANSNFRVRYNDLIV